MTARLACPSWSRMLLTGTPSATRSAAWPWCAVRTYLLVEAGLGGDPVQHIADVGVAQVAALQGAEQRAVAKAACKRSARPSLVDPLDANSLAGRSLGQVAVRWQLVGAVSGRWRCCTSPLYAVVRSGCVSHTAARLLPGCRPRSAAGR